MVRELQRKLRGLQDACRDASTAARISLGLSALEPSLEGSEEAGSPYLPAHSDQLGSLVDLMTSKLKVPLSSQRPAQSVYVCLNKYIRSSLGMRPRGARRANQTLKSLETVVTRVPDCTDTRKALHMAVSRLS